MSDKDTYMNQCPICERPFFCEHKRDFRCPHCRIATLEAQLAEIEEHNHRLNSWCRAYPYDVFIEVEEPDWKKANKVLADAGISMTAMNGSNMRHVIAGVKETVDDITAILDKSSK